MSLEFRRIGLTPDDPWAYPAAAIIFSTIHGQTGPPNESMIDIMARPIPGIRHYGLGDQDKVIAVATLGTVKDEQGKVTLDILAVTPEEQGKGFGRQMLERVTREARLLGASALQLFPTDASYDIYLHWGMVEDPDRQYHLMHNVPQAGDGPLERVGAQVFAHRELLSSGAALLSIVRDSVGRDVNYLGYELDDTDSAAAVAIVDSLATAQDHLEQSMAHLVAAEAAYTAYQQELGLAG